ncbi:MAG: cellulase family glycosylhydrolase [Lachnospiraceae bacterium]|nr:cellulase family glycosylhydrolase [Lachnospiraceae bacterium]
MKKVLLLACSAILCLSLAACSPSEKTEDAVSDVQVETQSAQKTSEDGVEDADKAEAFGENEAGDSGEKEDKSKSETTEKEEDGKPETTGKTALATPSVSGALHVEGTQLVDDKGNPVQLRGISTHGLSWFPQYVNQELFGELHKEWNANVMRLAMYTAENGGYCTDGDKNKLKQIVKDGVQYATNSDMYVIIDWHILRDENPNVYKDEAKKFFEEMSKEYAGADNVIYEICNEPNGGTSWADVKSYALEIIPIIRANDKDALIIVGTPTWCQDVDKAAADPITEYDNVMYALHFYATTHTDWLRDRMNKAIDAGLPIFVSEFGTCDASGSGAFDEYQSNEWIKALDAKGVSYVTWNLSNKNETSSIFKDGCSKTSGFSQDDLSQNGRWIYALLTGNREVGNSVSEDKSKSEVTEETKDNTKSNSSSNSANADEGSSDSDKEKEKKTADAVSGESDNFKYKATVTGSWESEGKKFYQYVLELENISGKDIDNWEISISFNGDIELSDGWNGNYSVSGSKLKITNMDYNGKVSAGSKVNDIGFIISGASDLSIK